MGKLSNLLTMLQMLQSGRKYTINELAEKIEVTPRMIRIYKDELEKAGVYVDSISGIYGGYVLNQKLSSIDVGFTKEDLQLLSLITKYVESKKDFIYKQEYNKFVERINEVYEKSNAKVSKIPFLTDCLSEKDTKNEIIKYNKFNYAIKNKRKVKIKYASVNSEVKIRVIHPCGLFIHDNCWYVSAYCELKKQTRSFILLRIMSYEILNETFE